MLQMYVELVGRAPECQRMPRRKLRRAWNAKKGAG